MQVEEWEPFGSATDAKVNARVSVLETGSVKISRVGQGGDEDDPLARLISKSVRTVVCAVRSLLTCASLLAIAPACVVLVCTNSDRTLHGSAQESGHVRAQLKLAAVAANMSHCTSADVCTLQLS